ncbi:hypothetical protein EYC84_010493 [Monilinia fructicola]|uniref:Uncharacterized protein n=1 Tax=Monilinia fructicola TaxID=38448 RepID=A0A5M9JGN7_MONFR|nr:hypothetical protein EYC84_010493 [Monilinia fructicola]
MSRNTQRESFKTPTKPKKSMKSKKPKKTTDYSSDSSYAGVDLISDSEDNDSDDEPDVFGRTGEEDDEIETIEDFTDTHDTPQGTNSYEDWSGFEGSPDDTLDDLITEEYNLDSDDSATSRDDESVMWHPDLFETDTSTHGPFLSADALPPGIARRLEDDTYNDDNGSDPESEVDWGNEDDNSSEESESDDSDASGYESDIGDDGGDTTDDEDWRENRPEADESMPRGNSPKPPPCLGFRIQRKKGQPDVITWYHNTDVPFVILDEHGKDLLINGSMEQYNPVLSNQANVMMNAVTDTSLEFGPYPQSDYHATQEAFLESNILTNENVVRPTSSSSYDGSESQSEPLLWADLVHLDENEDQDTMNEPIQAHDSSINTDDGLHPLLVHLDKGTNVGAFRLNRQNENLINSNTISKDALAFEKPKYLMPSSPASEVANRKRKSTSQGHFVRATMHISRLLKWRVYESSCPSLFFAFILSSLQVFQLNWRLGHELSYLWYTFTCQGISIVAYFVLGIYDWKIFYTLSRWTSVAHFANDMNQYGMEYSPEYGLLGAEFCIPSHSAISLVAW